MRQSPFPFPRAYRLKPVGDREEDALSQLRIGAAGQSVLVPFSAGLDYIAVAPAADAALKIEAPDFRVEPLGALAFAMGAGAPHAVLQEEEISEIS